MLHIHASQLGNSRNGKMARPSAVENVELCRVTGAKSLRTVFDEQIPSSVRFLRRFFARSGHEENGDRRWSLRNARFFADRLSTPKMRFGEESGVFRATTPQRVVRLWGGICSVAVSFVFERRS
ncbi:hypothetical protein MTP99_005245 [Tenebrio molitor]|nr:hypothetical protein MTP99_005245 [Tenebrio molitor]